MIINSVACVQKNLKKVSENRHMGVKGLTIYNENNNNKKEKFADFRETSTACSSWYAEFRTFEISPIRLKDMRNFHFPIFLTVCTYLKMYFYENFHFLRTFNQC